MTSTTQLSMTPYRNRSGSSGVAAYAVLDDEIIVQFIDGSRYRYGAGRPGRHHVGQMKSLAMAGRGLGSYIHRFVREKYEERL
jgi:hypothetical protein